MLTKKKSLALRNNDSTFRQKRQGVLGKEFLIMRPDNFAMHIRPVRLKASAVCAASGSLIYAGDYAYSCYENPLRISPYGPAKISIYEVERLGNDILPQGYISVRIPTYETMMSLPQIRKTEESRTKKLVHEASRLLTSGVRRKDA